MTDRGGNPKNQKIIDAIVEVASTEAGRTFFQYLSTRCFYQVSTIVGDPQSHEINPYGTLFNEAQRRLYLDIRRHIPANIRRKIEN